MSLKKYLVNARTKILEFKKKHNLLAEKTNNIPNEIPDIVNAAIEAGEINVGGSAKAYIHLVTLSSGSYPNIKSVSFVWEDTTEEHDFSTVGKFVAYVDGSNNAARKTAFINKCRVTGVGSKPTGYLNECLLKITNIVVSGSTITVNTSYYKQDTNYAIVYGGDIALAFNNQATITYSHSEL